jgi:macrolide transport system ATP-binding/permease protein
MRDGGVVSDQRRASVAPARTLVEADAIIHRNGGVAGAGALSTLMHGTGAAFALMIAGAALQALARNKMRAALTMLGVFIGVAALIAMVAVGQGANEAVRKQIESLGTNMFVVVPGASSSGGARGGYGSASTLTVADADAIRREVPSIAKVSYMIRQSGQVQFADQNWTTSIQGVTATYPQVTNWRIEAGRGISDEDVSSAALVVVLGQTVYRQLFADGDNAIGAVISVKGIPLRVVGLFESKGQSAMGQDQDDVVMIPFTTGERKILGVAAPTVAVTENALYPAISNPYGIEQRERGEGDRRSDRSAQRPTSSAAWYELRLQRAQPEPDRERRRRQQ